MNIKTLVVSITLAFSASAFASGDHNASAPCALEQSAKVGKKIELLPSPVYTLNDMKAAPPVALDGMAQFRWGQVMGWCAASPDCKAKLRAALEAKEGPWAGVKTEMLRTLDDPKMIEAQQRTWANGTAN